MPVLQLTNEAGTDFTVNLRRESTVLMDADRRDRLFTFDAEGRLLGAYLDGRNYRRGLSNEILEKQSGPRPGLSGRLRRLLTRPEVKQLEDLAYAFARTVADSTHPALTPEAAAALARIRSYDFTRLEEERRVYEEIYRPVTILPPDQYLALYLQATEGCSFNDCAFCGFYRDRRFHVKALDEFRAHMRRVRDFLRGGLLLRRSIFLGDANALMIPQPALIPLFDAVNAEFPNFGGIYSFVDAFATRHKLARDYKELAERGLRRVYIGLESGDARLLRFLGKPNTPEDVVRLVEQVKAGDASVGVIVLVGAGGAQYEEDHIRETARIVNSLQLDEGDLVYFSDLVDFPGSTYSARAAEAGLTPLSALDVERQAARLRAEFHFPDPAHRPRVSHYDIREFLY